jgi:hypothetical protein
MKKWLLLLAVIASYTYAFGQLPVAKVRTFGGNFTEEASEMISTMDGGYAIIGMTGSTQSLNTDVMLIKLDESLNCEWSQSYGGAGQDHGRSIKQLPDGSYILIASSNSGPSSSYDVTVLRITATGEVIWQYYYGGSDWDFAVCSALSSDQNTIWIGANTFSYGAGDQDAWVLQLSLDGEVISELFAGDSFYDELTDMELDPSGNLWASGSKWTSESEESAQAWLFEVTNDGTTQEFLYAQSPGMELMDLDFKGTLMLGGMTFLEDGQRYARLVRFNREWGLQWSVDEYTQWDLHVCQTPNWILTVSAGDIFGLGGVACHIFRRDLDSNWQIGPAFGGTGDDVPVSMTYYPGGKVHLLGKSDSYSESGEMDVYLVEFQTDSIEAEYELDILHNTCLPALGTDEPTQSDVADFMGTECDFRVFSLSGQLMLQDRRVISYADFTGWREPVLIVVHSRQGEMALRKVFP